MIPKIITRRMAIGPGVTPAPNARAAANGTHGVLTSATNVEDASAERHRYAKPDEDQRHGGNNAFNDRP
jgi:hypothetical protein